MLDLLLYAWLAWCAFNLACMALVVPKVPAFTGFRIVMPEALRAVLTPDEFHAVYLHECGHRHHWHSWKNFARACVFMWASHELRSFQELEADEYVRRLGCGVALASALRKLSSDRFDRMRAEFLEIEYA